MNRKGLPSRRNGGMGRLYFRDWIIGLSVCGVRCPVCGVRCSVFGVRYIGVSDFGNFSYRLILIFYLRFSSGMAHPIFTPYDSTLWYSLEWVSKLSCRDKDLNIFNLNGPRYPLMPTIPLTRV